MPPKRRAPDGGGPPATKKARRGSASGAATPSADLDGPDAAALSSSSLPNGPGSNAAAAAAAGSASSSSSPPPLSIDTSEAGTAPAAATTDGPSGGGGNQPTDSATKATRTPPTTGGVDSHPYARGAVIEVLHGVEEKGPEGDGERIGSANTASDDEWWELDSSSDEDGEGDEENDEEPSSDDDAQNDGDRLEEEGDQDESKQGDSNDDEEGDDNDEDDDDENYDNNFKTSSQAESQDAKNHKTKKKRNDKPHVTVRLCDVIDRVAIGDGKYRYYVHYRDFNRRMDEWISMSRIVSPPSVGNAKARAIKREEEKKKKQQLREQEKKAEEAVDVSAPRASRRRSTLHAPQPGGGPADNNAGATPGTPGEGGQEEGGLTRRRRRRTGGDTADDATVVAGNQGEGGGGPGNAAESSGPVMAAEKGIVALPTAVVAKVGEHVVQTIEAQELDEHEGLDEASLREHEEVTKVKNVAFLELGPFQMETWYFSPLPKEVLSENGFIEVLYVCEFTFHMFARKSELRRWQSRLPSAKRHPPGNEIYRSGNLSMFEVDGFEERIYCQNLCYIAKLFLDHKTLYFDVDPFLFYVLCEFDERGFHPVGYYSKEKYSDVGYNLACILTFPSHQRKGYGRFLIAFSYELSKKEEKVGSPEKPMSDLGQQAYKPYWASTIVDFLINQCPDDRSMSIMDISKSTSIMAEDIVFTLNQLGILKIINGVYFIAAEEGLLKTLSKKYPVKEPRVDASKLHWSPFITDVKRDKFSIHSKKPSVEGEETRGAGGFP